MFIFFYIYNRAVLEDEFTQSETFSENFQNWDEFIKTPQYQELIDKFI